MDDEDQKMWAHIEKYLEACAPVHWLIWVSRCSDSEAKKQIESVLFKDGGLRDLTNASVKKEVLDAIRQTPHLMQIVIKDLANEVQQHTGEDLSDIDT